jgi:hypothetical protein
MLHSITPSVDLEIQNNILMVMQNTDVLHNVQNGVFEIRDLENLGLGVGSGGWG